MEDNKLQRRICRLSEFFFALSNAVFYAWKFWIILLQIFVFLLKDSSFLNKIP